jgi:hypothetical protein
LAARQRDDARRHLTKTPLLRVGEIHRDAFSKALEDQEGGNLGNLDAFRSAQVLSTSCQDRAISGRFSRIG